MKTVAWRWDNFILNFTLNSNKHTGSVEKGHTGTNIPTDDDAVIKQVDFDVLDSDGLVEALGD